MFRKKLRGKIKHTFYTQCSIRFFVNLHNYYQLTLATKSHVRFIIGDLILCLLTFFCILTELYNFFGRIAVLFLVGFCLHTPSHWFDAGQGTLSYVLQTKIPKCESWSELRTYRQKTVRLRHDQLSDSHHKWTRNLSVYHRQDFVRPYNNQMNILGDGASCHQ